MNLVLPVCPPNLRRIVPQSESCFHFAAYWHRQNDAASDLGLNRRTRNPSDNLGTGEPYSRSDFNGFPNFPEIAEDSDYNYSGGR